MIEDFLSFLGVSAIVIITPGQDTVLTIRNTLIGGRRGGGFTALGVAAGQAVWAFATSAGLAALIAASEPAFAALRLMGAAYLIYLGAKAVLGALHRVGDRLPGRDRPVEYGLGLEPRVGFYQGLISNLGNPKMAVFFVSLLPAFAPRSGAAFYDLLALGLVFCTMTVVWLLGYALVVAKAGDVLRRPRIRRSLEAASGAVLVALGVRLAAESR